MQLLSNLVIPKKSTLSYIFNRIKLGVHNETLVAQSFVFYTIHENLPVGHNFTGQVCTSSKLVRWK